MEKGAIVASPDFIPDGDFTPDLEPGVKPISSGEAADFIPDTQFRSDDDALQEKYGTPGQMAITAAESAGRGLLGPIAPGIERLAGVNPEDIRGREEANPITSGVSEAAGFVAPAIATLGGSAAAQGAAKLTQLGAIGLAEKGLEKLGFKAGETLASKIGAGAAKSAISNMLLTGSDEVSKMILNDPNQSAESAINHIGLSGAIGAALGGGLATTAGLWEKSVGSKAETAIDDFKGRMAAHQGEEYIPPTSIRRKDNVFSTRGTEAQDVLGEAPVEFVAKKEVDTKSLGSKLADLVVHKGLSASIGAAAGHALGIPHALGALLGSHFLGPYVDSVLPALAKKLIDNPISAAGFKAASDFGVAVTKSDSMMNRAAKNLFIHDAVPLPTSAIPDQKQRDKLEKQLDEIQKSPTPLFNQDDKLRDYMPDHADAMQQSLGNVISYLQGIKAHQDKQSPLDTKPVLSSTQKQSYANALNIAQKPLLIVDKIKNGTVTGQDLQHLGTMYPSLYNGLKQRLMNAMTDHVAKGKTVPYKTRIGLSMFLAQPLDSTMAPSSIMAAQPKPQQPTSQQNSQSKGTKSSPALQKMPSMYSTPDQKRSERQQK